MTIHLTADELHRIGHRLYGPAWKGQLAVAIGRSRYSVYRWARNGVACKPAAELIRHLDTSPTGKDAE